MIAITVIDLSFNLVRYDITTADWSNFLTQPISVQGFYEKLCESAANSRNYFPMGEM